MWHDFVEMLVNSGAGLGDRLTTSLPRMASISNAGAGEYDGDEVCGASSFRAALGHLQVRLRALRWRRESWRLYPPGSIFSSLSRSRWTCIQQYVSMARGVLTCKDRQTDCMSSYQEMKAPGGTLGR